MNQIFGGFERLQSRNGQYVEGCGVVDGFFVVVRKEIWLMVVKGVADWSSGEGQKRGPEIVNTRLRP